MWEAGTLEGFSQQDTFARQKSTIFGTCQSDVAPRRAFGRADARREAGAGRLRYHGSMRFTPPGSRLPPLLALVLLAPLATAAGAEDELPRELKLPGLRIDFRQRYIDVDATVCLHDGLLELVACGKGTKEHESIIAIEPRPMHVHAALLALGAEPGRPGMLFPNLDPGGDPVEVSLVVPDEAGAPVERTIDAFVTLAGGELTGLPPTGGDAEPPAFPKTFVFAGSQMHQEGEGPAVYVADETGSVVSIVTFGDELLCPAEVQSSDNGELIWRVDATHLPKVGAKVVLRLRPRSRREVLQMRGWEVLVNRALLERQAEATARAIQLLDEQLAEIEKVVPAAALEELRKVPLYLNPQYPGEPPGAEYHPDAAWLREHGRDPVMARGVEFTNIDVFEADRERMPNFVLHELAHGYHHRSLPNGFDNAEILAAYARAKESGVYDKVERWFGNGKPNTFESAYALTTPQEYFAETSEAFFSRNDFYPFTNAELRRHDPAMFAILTRLWRVE